MLKDASRRHFLKSSVAACAGSLGAALASGTPASAAEPSSALPPASAPDAAPLPIKKGVLVDMLPKNLSYTDRFKLARDVGFNALQVNTTPDPHQADEIKQAADSAGIRIDSVMNMDHWKWPLSSADMTVV